MSERRKILLSAETIPKENGNSEENEPGAQPQEHGVGEQEEEEPFSINSMYSTQNKVSNINPGEGKFEKKPIISELRTKNPKNQQTKQEEEKGEKKMIKPPKKLLMYHRKKEDVAIVDPDLQIYIKPKERGLDFIDNTNKLPYRFHQQ